MSKNIKKEKLDIRVSSGEKKKLVRRAKQLELSLSEYVREILFARGENKGCHSLMFTALAVQASEIVNHVQEYYGQDEKIERMAEELWKSMEN